MNLSEWSFTILGETPAKKNSKIWNKTRNIILPGRKYTDWHKSALIQLRAGPRPRIPLQGPLSVRVVFFHGDRIRRDSDNGLSSVMDLLVDAQILQDDKWEIVREISVRNEYDKKSARCDIRIIEFSEEGR